MARGDASLVIGEQFQAKSPRRVLCAASSVRGLFSSFVRLAGSFTARAKRSHAVEYQPEGASEGKSWHRPRLRFGLVWSHE